MYTPLAADQAEWVDMFVHHPSLLNTSTWTPKGRHMPKAGWSQDTHDLMPAGPFVLSIAAAAHSGKMLLMAMSWIRSGTCSMWRHGTLVYCLPPGSMPSSTAILIMLPLSSSLTNPSLQVFPKEISQRLVRKVTCSACQGNLSMSKVLSASLAACSAYQGVHYDGCLGICNGPSALNGRHWSQYMW